MFDYLTAKKEGYNDDEILDYLKGTRQDFDFDSAVSEGYSIPEVVDYVSKKPVKQPTVEPIKVPEVPPPAGTSILDITKKTEQKPLEVKPLPMPTPSIAPAEVTAVSKPEIPKPEELLPKKKKPFVGDIEESAKSFVRNIVVGPRALQEMQDKKLEEELIVRKKEIEELRKKKERGGLTKSEEKRLLKSERNIVRDENNLELNKKIVEKLKQAEQSQALKPTEVEKLPGMGGFAQDVTSGLTQIGGQFLARAVNPALGAAAIASQIGGNTIEILESSGIEQKEAVPLAILNATIQYPLEKLGMAKIAIGALGKGVPVLKSMLSSFIGEGGTEAVQQIPDDVFGQMWAETKGKNLDEKIGYFKDNWKRLVTDAGYSGIVGGVVGGVAGGVGRAITPERKQEIKPISEAKVIPEIVEGKGAKTLADFKIPAPEAYFKLPEQQRNQIFPQLSDAEQTRVMEAYPEKLVEEAEYAEGTRTETEKAGREAQGLEREAEKPIRVRYPERDRLETGAREEITPEEGAEALRRAQAKLPLPVEPRLEPEKEGEIGEKAKYLVKRLEKAEERPPSPYQLEQPTEADRATGERVAKKYGLTFKEAVEGDRDAGGVRLKFTDQITNQEISVTSINAEAETAKIAEQTRKEKPEEYGRRIAETAGVEFLGKSEVTTEALGGIGRYKTEIRAKYRTPKGETFTAPFSENSEEIAARARVIDERTEVKKEIAKPPVIETVPFIAAPRPTQENDRKLRVYIESGKQNTELARYTQNKLVNVFDRVSPKNIATATGFSYEEVIKGIDGIRASQKNEQANKLRNALAPSLAYGETVEEAVESMRRIEEPVSKTGEVMFQREGELRTPEQKAQIQRLQHRQIEGITRLTEERGLTVQELAEKRINDFRSNLLKDGLYYDEKGELQYANPQTQPGKAQDYWTQWERDLERSIGATPVSQEAFEKSRKVEREEVKFQPAEKEVIPAETGIRRSEVKLQREEKPVEKPPEEPERPKEAEFEEPPVWETPEGETARFQKEKKEGVREPTQLRREPTEAVRSVTERPTEAARPEAPHAVPETMPAIMAFTRAIERNLGRSLPKNSIKQVDTPPIEVCQVADKFVSEALGRMTVFFRVSDEARAMGVSIGGGILTNESDTVYINESTQKPHIITVVHEAMHIMKDEQPDLYYPVLRTMAEQRTPDFDKYLVKMMDEKGYTEKEVLEETVAEISGERFTDPEFLRTLAGRNPDAFSKFVETMRRVIQQIKDWLKASKIEHAGKYFRDLDKVDRALQDAFTEMKRRRRGTGEQKLAAQRETKFEKEKNESIIESVVTNKIPEEESYRFGRAAWIENGEIKAIHLTDDPQRVNDLLKSGKSIAEGRGEEKYGDLGRGLYGSAVPQFWSGRSRDKYSFMDNLTEEQRNKLADAVLNSSSMTSKGYLSESEKEYVKNHVEHFLKNYNENKEYSKVMLQQIAGQPYNIDFWKPDFLEPLGIEKGKAPKEVVMRLKGRFAEINQSGITQEQSENLKKHGLDGAFTKSGFTTNPQIVVWNNEAIIGFEVETAKDMFQRERPQAETFYSPTLKAVQGLKQERGTGEQMFAMITKTPGVKEAEWKWMGLDDFLKGKQREGITYAKIKNIPPDEKVAIYKGVPKGTELKSGDFVTTDKEQALFYARDIVGQRKQAEHAIVIKKEVPAKDIIQKITQKHIADEYIYEPQKDIFTRKEIEEFVAQNQVRVEEVRKSDKPLPKMNFEDYLKMRKIEKTGNEFKTDGLSLSESKIREQYEKFLSDENERMGWKENERRGGTKFSQYSLPSGTNYREVLLTLPGKQKIPDPKAERFADRVGQPENQFKSSHWDEPNVIAHVRLDDRTGPNGEKVLFIEEIQSDYAREAREKGVKKGIDFTGWTATEIQYADMVGNKTYIIKDKDGNELTTVSALSEQSAIDKATDSAREIGVPAQPFLKNWEELVLKRVLRMAAEKEYDRVAWVNGKQTADRYDLSKHIGKAVWNEDKKMLTAYDPQMEKTVIQQDINDPKELADYIGKGAAQKLIDAKPDVDGDREISGLDLKVGGEWAVNLYDRMIPKFYEKYGKRWNAKVEPVKLNTGSLDRGAVPEGQKGPTLYSGIQQSIAITPEMHESVLYEGQPMFQREKHIKGEKQTDTPEFKKWFGESKVVDEEGNPLVVYHGTADKITEFNKVERGRLTKVRSAKEGFFFTSSKIVAEGYSQFARPKKISILEERYKKLEQIAQRLGTNAAWDKYSKAYEEYEKEELAYSGDERRKRSHIIETYLSIKNPLVHDYKGEDFRDESYAEIINKAKEKGNDGVIFKNTYDGVDEPGSYSNPITDVYVVFEPTQIKSAIANVGTFSIKNPDIRFQREEPVRPGIPKETTVEHFTRRVIDRFERLRIIQNYLGKPATDDENAYLQQELMHGRIESQINDVERDYLEPLEKEMAKAKVDIDGLDRYLYAKHAEDRNRIIAERNKRFRFPELFAQTAGSGMTDEQARAELKRFDEEGKTETLQKLADTVYELNEKRLQIMIDGDLITKEQSDEWKETFGKFYVPLKGLSPELSAAQVKRLSILSEKKAAGETPLTDTEQDEYEHLTEISSTRPAERPRIGRGFSLRGKEVQAAYGRRSTAQHILANVVNDINSAVIRAEKNKVGQAMLGYARKHPDPTVFEIEPFEEKPYFSAATGEVEYRDQPEKTYRDKSSGMLIEPMIVKERGKPTSLLIKDPALAGAMQNLGSEKMGKLLQAMGTFSKYFSLINTQVSPEFIVTNLTRDIQTALINVTGVTDKSKVKGAAAEVAKNIPKAVRGAWKGLHNEKDTEWSKWFNEYEKAGGKIGWFGLDTVEDIQKRLTTRLTEMQGTPKANTLKIWRGSVEMIRNLNGAVENATRLSVYVAMRKRGLTEQQAASVAKNITVNFNKHGELGPLFNSLYAFSNASIQGSTRLVAALKSRKVQILAGSIAAASFAVAQINRLMSGDDDDDEPNYDKVPTWEKQNNMVFMLGAGRNRVKIPLPYGYNVFWAVGQALDQAIHKSGGAVTTLAGAIANSFNPLGNAGSTMQMVFPTAVRWIADLGINKDFTGRPILREEKYGPKKSQAFMAQRGTTETSKKIAETLAYMTWGKEYDPGYIERIPRIGKYLVSPDAYDYTLEYFTGGIGRFCTNAIRTAQSAAIAKKVELQYLPFVRRFYGTTTETADRTKFYENMERLERVKAQYKTYRESDRDKEADALRKKHIAEWELVGGIEQIKRTISAMNSIRDKLEKKGNKKEADALGKKIIEKMKKINKTINKK